MDNSKIPGIYYAQYVNKDTGKTTVVPSSPPFTTWSGYMECRADSPHAQRLMKKCGGVTYKVKVEEKAEGEEKPTIKEEPWVKGFWTAPVDWPEMAAGRESATPFSPTTYKASDFPFVLQKGQ